jgi:hypothetical protein
MVTPAISDECGVDISLENDHKQSHRCDESLRENPDQHHCFALRKENGDQNSVAA